MRRFVSFFALAIVLGSRVSRADEAEARFSVHANFDDVHAYVGDIGAWRVLAPNAIGNLPRVIETTRTTRHRETITVLGHGEVHLDVRGAGDTTKLVAVVSMPHDAPVSTLGEVAGVASGIERRFEHGSWDWYGWQMVLVDAAAIAASLAIGYASLEGLDSASPAGAVLAMSMPLLSGPIVHLAHRRWVAAAASFGMRVALLGLASFIAIEISMSAPLYKEDSNAALTASYGIGSVVASALDAAFLCSPRVPEGTHVTPTISMSPFGLAGRF